MIVAVLSKPSEWWSFADALKKHTIESVKDRWFVTRGGDKYFRVSCMQDALGLHPDVMRWHGTAWGNKELHQVFEYLAGGGAMILPKSLEPHDFVRIQRRKK